MRIKKGDKVVVTAGKDKGAVGKVIAAYPRDERVLVEGVNQVTKHQKPTQTARGGARPGEIVHQEASIHVSNVAVAVEAEVDGKKKTVGSKVGYRFNDDGEKVRYAKRTGEEI